MSSKKSFSFDEAKKIGEQLGIKWDKFDVEQFRQGMDVELDYYTRLEKMEKEAEDFWEAK